MKRIADRAGATQTGNVRRLNEDSYLIREPLFMVADGMGGAAGRRDRLADDNRGVRRRPGLSALAARTRCAT